MKLARRAQTPARCFALVRERRAGRALPVNDAGTAHRAAPSRRTDRSVTCGSGDTSRGQRPVPRDLLVAPGAGSAPVDG